MLFISIESNSCIVLLSCSLLHRHSKGVGGKLKKGIILLLSFNDLNVSPSFLHLLVIRHLVPEKVHLFKCIYFNSLSSKIKQIINCLDGRSRFLHDNWISVNLWIFHHFDDLTPIKVLRGNAYRSSFTYTPDVKLDILNLLKIKTQFLKFL